MTDMTNIVRVDNDDLYQHYWRVNFQAFKIQKTFSDGVHGGKKKALAKALEFRDKTKKKHPPNYSGTVNNKGHYKNVKGVYFRLNQKNSDTGWVAFWDEKIDGKRKQRQKRFSVHKYGSREARKLAIEYRQKKVRQK